MGIIGRIAKITGVEDFYAGAIDTALNEGNTTLARQYAVESAKEAREQSSEVRVLRHHARKIANANGNTNGVAVTCLETIWRLQGRAYQEGEAQNALHFHSTVAQEFSDLCGQFVRFLVLRHEALAHYTPGYGVDRQESDMELLGLEDTLLRHRRAANARRNEARLERQEACPYAEQHRGRCSECGWGSHPIGADAGFRIGCVQEVVKRAGGTWTAQAPDNKDLKACGFVRGTYPVLTEAKTTWAMTGLVGQFSQLVASCSSDIRSLKAVMEIAQMAGVFPVTRRESLKKQSEELPTESRETEQGRVWSF